MAISGNLAEGNVLVRYTGDASQLQAVLDKLATQAGDTSQAMGGVAKGWGDAVNEMVKKAGELDLAFEGVKKLFEFGKEAFHEYANELRLSTAAAGADMEKLREASRGLRTEDELRQFAAKAMHGVQALTNQQMAETQAAMVELTRRGFDQNEVTEKLTNAVVGLKTKGLDKLGIALDESASSGDKFGAIMAKIHELSEASEKSTGTEAESIARLGVEYEDSMNKIKESLGKVVVALAPILQAMAKMVEYVAKLVDYATSKEHGLGMLGAGLGGGTMGVLDQGAKYKAAGGKVDFDTLVAGMAGAYLGTSDTGFSASNYSGGEAGEGGEGGAGGPAGFRARIKALLAAQSAQAEGWFDKDPWGGAGVGDVVDMIGAVLEHGSKKLEKDFKDARAEAIKKALELAKMKREISWKSGKEGTDTLLRQLQEEQLDEFGVGAAFFGRSVGPSLGTSAGGLSTDQQMAALQQSYAKGGVVDQNTAQAYDVWKKKQEGSFLEGTFGKITEFEAYKKAFEGLSHAVDSAFKAWINGSESLGQAFRQAVSGAVAAIASQMLIESLKHAAYAIGSAAFYDYEGAATHAKAAAAFAAGAVIAGATARELGGGGGGGAASGGGSGAANTYNSGARSGGANQHGSIIVYGDSFADDSPYMRQIKAKKMVDLALGRTSGGMSS